MNAIKKGAARRGTLGFIRILSSVSSSSSVSKAFTEVEEGHHHYKSRDEVEDRDADRDV